MIRAVIFDMDGVISDTQKLHASVEEELLRGYGIRMGSKEITQKYAGFSDRELFEDVFHSHRISIDVNRAIREKWDMMMALASGNISPVSGAMGFIGDLEKQKFRLGAASSSPLMFIELVLFELKLKGRFDIIASAEEVKHGKPNPDVFLLAAERLNVQPQECVVIEDGFNGMLAAKAAGMKCIGLVEDVQHIYPADLLVNDLKKLTAEKIRRL